jgi:hypothetical protein
MTNIQELKSINKLALINEMIEKTKNCALIWHELSPKRFKSSQNSYDFYLSQTAPSIYSLDVLKNGRLSRAYNSSTQIGVSELFQTVESALISFERQKSVSSFLGRIRSCAPVTHEITMNGGIVGSGDSIFSQLDPINVLLFPISLSFGETSFPWSGDYTLIDDTATSNNHDSDSTYIRQEVSGMLPTNWGYANIGFSLNDLPPTAPFSFTIRIAHRREVQPGVNLQIALVVNSIVIYSTTIVSSSSYSVFSSGQQLLSGITEIEDLQVRLNMFTNTGDLDPRAIRISAVDLRFFGHNIL